MIDGISPFTVIHIICNINPESSKSNRSILYTSVCSQSSSPNEYIYHVKWIRFRGRTTSIITQNENGPCPLIAISNVLLLQNVISLPQNTEVVTGERLITTLTDVLLSKSLKGLDKGQLLNYETTVSDALNLFPSLQTGLDVNVRFTDVSAFEFTSVLGVFDLFGISLYHGWLVDPRDMELASVVGNRTYNQLVEQIIHLKASTNPEDVHKGLLADTFLEQTASQLTYHGLYELADTLNEGQLAVLFRNNHFSTIIKHQVCPHCVCVHTCTLCEIGVEILSHSFLQPITMHFRAPVLVAHLDKRAK
ncbi:unnamed protein product [Echinostoma caproni]|uniref:Ubiquitin carboxyl-terminal hydrolase n=1 Tax=Echinostoma caproni TaxID=27848 RepID=A0A3P8IAR0_9TREM|nr:unnamed protein product [Echinostoma caproni]